MSAAAVPVPASRRDRQHLALIAVLVILSLVAGVLAALTYRHSEVESGELNRSVIRHLDVASTLEFETQESRRRLLYALASEEPEVQLAAIEHARTSDASVVDALHGARTQLAPTAHSIVDDTLRHWELYTVERDEVVSLILEGHHTEAVAYDTGSAEAAFQVVRRDIGNLRRHLAADANVSIELLQSDSRVSLYALLGVVALTQFLAVFGYRQLQKGALVDQLVAATRAAEESTRAKSAFVANMSHELRTPLNAIIGYTEMIKEEADASGHSQMSGDLQRVLGAARHLLSLINGVLDFSKIEAGHMELDVIDCDLSELVRDVASTTSPLAATHGNRLSVEGADSLGRAYADPTKVRQVLLNLIGNACKFTKDGQVSVTATRFTDDRGDRVRFEVRDTGIGTSPEQISRLFQDFVQADASTTRKYGGTGLGLALVKRLVELMGGTVTVVSEPHHGSTFTVDLPIRRSQATPGDHADRQAGAADTDALVLVRPAAQTSR